MHAGVCQSLGVYRKELHLGHVSGLLSFRALGDVKFHFLTFLQGSIALTFDCGMMDKDILAILARDKAIALLIAEPFHFTSCHYFTSHPFRHKKAAMHNLSWYALRRVQFPNLLSP